MAVGTAMAVAAAIALVARAGAPAATHVVVYAMFLKEIRRFARDARDDEAVVAFALAIRPWRGPP